MPQIDESLSNIIRHFLDKKEGWVIQCPESVKPRRLSFDFAPSLLTLNLSMTDGCDWLDIKLNSNENIRQLCDYDIFDEVYTCNDEIINLFLQKHKELVQNLTVYNDYGDIKTIFKELWEGFVNFLK